MINIQSTYSQKTINDIEEHIFAAFFNLSNDNKIAQIIEENERSEVTRKWKFNEKGQLTKECDWRESGYSSSSSIINSSTTTYREFVYEYLADGKVNQIMETEVKNGDTLRIHHKFDYTEDDEIRESYRTKLSERLEMEYLVRAKYHNELLDTLTRSNISHMTEVYAVHKTKEIFKYDEKGILTNKMNYSSMNSIPITKYNRFEELNSINEFIYDDLGRISEIIDNAMDEQGENYLHRKVQFQYEGDGEKIIGVMTFAESYRPREVNYKIKYKNGRVSQVKVNDDIFHYIVEVCFPPIFEPQVKLIY
ncbi:MAG: hypothetical protein AAF573_19930 [Bacteroidota bacterium]